MAMQRFTVKLSFQPGRKLGLILDDYVVETEPYEYYSDDEEEDLLISMRGGGGGRVSTPCVDSSGSEDGDDDDDRESSRGHGGSSLQKKIDAEEAAAAKAAPRIAIPPHRSSGDGNCPLAMRGGGSTIEVDSSESDDDIDDDDELSGGCGSLSLQMEFAAEAAAARGFSIPPLGGHKRKRATRLRVRKNSVVFQHTRNLRAATDKLFSSLGPNSHPQQVFDASNLDALIEWGEDNLPPIKFRRNVLIPFDEINSEALKFAFTGTIKEGDFVEKIQHTRPPPSSAGKLVPLKDTCRPDVRKRCCRPYFRSDHFTTIYCENKASTEVATLLRDPQIYPLYITFKRHIPASNNGASMGDDYSPPRKRLKRSESNMEPNATNNGQSKDDVICLLDSSDEEESVSVKSETRTNGGSSTAVHASEQVPLHLRGVPPDPPTMPTYDDDFVLTPFGPGKILSSRVERYACSDARSDATIFKPTIIYSIDLSFGTCHVSASQVTPISGTPYTDKTLFTYQRMPLNEHDLLRLRPMTYLNDSIVNFYLKYLKMQFDRNNPVKPVTKGRSWDDLDGEGVHIFPSFCYTRMKNIMGSATRNSKKVRTKIWNALKSWTKKTDIFKKKLLVFPINESLHWTCVFVCHPGRLVRRYAKDLKGRKGNTISPESTATAAPGVSQLTTNKPTANLKVDKPVRALGMIDTDNSATNSNEKPTANSEVDKPVPALGVTNGKNPITNSGDEPTANSKADVPVPALGVTNGENHMTNSDDKPTANSRADVPVPALGVTNGENPMANSYDKPIANSRGDKPVPALGMTNGENPITNSDYKPIANSKADKPVPVLGMTNGEHPMTNSDDKPTANLKADKPVPALGMTNGENSMTNSYDKPTSNEVDKPVPALGMTNRENLTTHSDDKPTANAEVDKLAPELGMTNRENPMTNSDDKPTANAKVHKPVPDLGMKSSSAGDNHRPDSLSQNDATAMKLHATEAKSAGVNSGVISEFSQPNIRWQCDFCHLARFDEFDDAVEHEKICDKNIDWCMIHFDSGKHFMLHKTNEITGNIRKYLNAYYEAEYAPSHPGLSSMTTKNMPGFAAAVPQQDNTKDCGVYMLENAERMLHSTSVIDNAFVKMKGATKKNFFGKDRYDKIVIEKKRDDILQLIQSLRREHIEIM